MSCALAARRLRCLACAMCRLAPGLNGTRWVAYIQCWRWDSCFMSHTLTGPKSSNSAAVHANMTHVRGGTFRMGSDHHYPEEAPTHLVTVDPFWIDTTPVTNRQFAEFVRA